MARLLRHRQTKEAETDRPGLTSTAPHSYSTVKPLRRECRIASAEPVCSCAHFFVHIAHETAGAARIRHSLRPLFSRGAKLACKPRADRAARTPMHICSLKIESPVSAPARGGIRKACGPHSHSRNRCAPVPLSSASGPINFSLFSRRSVHPRPPLSAKMSPRAADS
jgi:hypothetical protein